MWWHWSQTLVDRSLTLDRSEPCVNGCAGWVSDVLRQFLHGPDCGRRCTGGSLCCSDDGRCHSDDGRCRSSDNQCSGDGLGWLGVGVLLSGGLLHVLGQWLGHNSLSLGLHKRFYPSGMVVQKLVSNVPAMLINNIYWLQKEYFNFAFRLSKIKDFIRSTELSFYKI